MQILDYPKPLGADGSITIPPFHTGHLGFIPNTPTHVYLMHPKNDREPSYYEVLITPFPRRVNHMVRVECIFKDKKGVVKNLVDAISDLKINIVTQQSSVIDHLNHHHVSMILDLSSSRHSRGSLSAQDIRDYEKYRQLVPLNDQLVLELFESIMSRCSDLIEWEDMSGVPLPRININWIHNQYGVDEEDTSIVEGERGKPKGYRGVIKLPKYILKKISSKLKSKDETLHYLIVSETEESILRLFIFEPKFSERVVHVGFFHDDAPGALSAILEGVASAEFNILTSLLRKKAERESVWEAVLEADSAIPDGEDINRYKWIAEQIENKSDEHTKYQLWEKHVSIGPPDYPQINSERFEIVNDIPKNRYNSQKTCAIEGLDLSERKEIIANSDLNYSRERLQILSKIENRSRNRPRKIFLSFPTDAQRHAEHVKNVLSNNEYDRKYDVVDGMGHHGKDILSDIITKIQDADFFIGIWHHDNRARLVHVNNSNIYSVSPWMPFEYGVAEAMGKPTIIMVSEQVDKTIWKRIKPGTNKIMYSDINFVSESIKDLIMASESVFSSFERE